MRIIWITSVLVVAFFVAIGISYVWYSPLFPGATDQLAKQDTIDPFVDETESSTMDASARVQSPVTRSDLEPDISQSSQAVMQQSVMSDAVVHNEENSDEVIVGGDLVEPLSEDEADAVELGLNDNENQDTAELYNRKRFEALADAEMLRMAQTIGLGQPDKQNKRLANSGDADTTVKQAISVEVEDAVNSLNDRVTGKYKAVEIKQRVNHATNDNDSTSRKPLPLVKKHTSERDQASSAAHLKKVAIAEVTPTTNITQDSNDTFGHITKQADQPAIENTRQDAASKAEIRTALRKKYLESTGLEAYPEDDDHVLEQINEKSEGDLQSANIDQIAIIVHSANKEKISVADLKNIYLDRITHWESGAKITLYNLPLEDQWREEFSQKILNMSAMDAAKAESNRVITNKAVNLPQVKTLNLVVTYVARNPNAIAYVPLSSINGNSRVKVLMTVP